MKKLLLLITLLSVLTACNLDSNNTNKVPAANTTEASIHDVMKKLPGTWVIPGSNSGLVLSSDGAFVWHVSFDYKIKGEYTVKDAKFPVLTAKTVVIEDLETGKITEHTTGYEAGKVYTYMYDYNSDQIMAPVSGGYSIAFTRGTL